MLDSIKKQVLEIQDAFFGFANLFMSQPQTAFVILNSNDKEINSITISTIPKFIKIQNYKDVVIMGSMSNVQSSYDYKHIEKDEIKSLMILQRAFHPFFNVYFNNSLGYDDKDFYQFLGINEIDKSYIIENVVYDMYSDKKRRNAYTKSPNDVWNNINEKINKYLESYLAIRQLYPKKMLIIHPFASGDTYMSCLYLEKYINDNNISEYEVIVANNASKKIAELFGFEAKIFEEKQLVDTICLGRFVGMDKINILNTNMYVGSQRGFKMWYKVDYNTYMQKWVFESSHRETYPCIRQESSDYLFEKYKLEAGKTILIAPNSYSVEAFGYEMYDNIIAELKERGFQLCTNVSNDEQQLPGTIGVYIPYDVVIDFVNRCYAFIGMRSGLCDIISSTSTKMVVFHRQFCFRQFSLVEMGTKVNNIKEIIVDNMTKEEVTEEAMNFLP